MLEPEKFLKILEYLIVIFGQEISLWWSQFKKFGIMKFSWETDEVMKRHSLLFVLKKRRKKL